MILRKIRQTSWLLLGLFAGLVSAGDINFSGFLSVGGGKLSDDRSKEFAGYTEEDLTFDSESLIGLQVSSELSDRVTVTGQYTSRGTDEYATDISWAYVSFEATDTLTLRLGRFRAPFYMYSDYVDVGYAYQWVRAPFEVYRLPFSNINGVDLLWRDNVGPVDLSFQGYFGAFSGAVYNRVFNTDITLDTRNQMGAIFTLGWNWFTFRYAKHTAQATNDLDTIDVTNAAGTDPVDTIAEMATILTALGYSSQVDNMLTNEDDVDFTSIGIQVDTGMFVLAAESTELEADSIPTPNDKSSYVMAGLRFGNVLIHATQSKIEDEYQNLAEGIVVNSPTTGAISAILTSLSNSFISDRRDVNSIGIRWDFTPSAAFKLQIDDIDYENDTAIDAKVTAFSIQTVF